MPSRIALTTPTSRWRRRPSRARLAKVRQTYTRTSLEVVGTYNHCLQLDVENVALVARRVIVYLEVHAFYDRHPALFKFGWKAVSLVGRRRDRGVGNPSVTSLRMAGSVFEQYVVALYEYSPDGDSPGACVVQLPRLLNLRTLACSTS